MSFQGHEGSTIMGVTQYDTPESTPEQKRSAALYVCSQAKSVEDARELLEMLGLVGEDLPANACPKCRRFYGWDKRVRHIKECVA